MATVPDNSQRNGQEPIDISLSRTTGALQLTVRDHGPGMVADQLRQLGQAFFRLDAARQRRLGLHLGCLVINAHDGEIVLKSAGPGLSV